MSDDLDRADELNAVLAAADEAHRPALAALADLPSGYVVAVMRETDGRPIAGFTARDLAESLVRGWVDAETVHAFIDRRGLLRPGAEVGR